MRIAAAFAGLGAAVGGALFVGLRFVVGQSVRDGLGNGAYDLPRRYVDYLPLHESAVASNVRGCAELLGAGLICGVAVGVLWTVLRARRPALAGRRSNAVALASCGFVLGGGMAVALHFVSGRITHGADFGWYVQGEDGVLYGGGPTPAWWPLVVTGAAVGLLVGAVAAGGAVWTGRARRA